MKSCSLNDFMNEMKPWLDSNHIRGAQVDENGHFILHFIDGMKNVYIIDDCSHAQIDEVLRKLENQGIPVQS